MTITVKAYDNGLVEVDGRPINQAMPSDSYCRSRSRLPCRVFPGVADRSD
jgi:hypothetical protein